MFKNEEGFSLLELVVAVGVAGIIAAVALPTFAGIQATSRSTSSTYAASANAAEALANSTIGTTGSASSSSTAAVNEIKAILDSATYNGMSLAVPGTVSYYPVASTYFNYNAETNTTELRIGNWWDAAGVQTLASWSGDVSLDKYTAYGDYMKAAGYKWALNNQHTIFYTCSNVSEVSMPWSCSDPSTLVQYFVADYVGGVSYPDNQLPAYNFYDLEVARWSN